MKTLVLKFVFSKHHFFLQGGGKAACYCCLVARSCPTLCDPVDYSPPGSSIHGILQARIPEWIAISFSRGYSPPSDHTCVSFVFCMAGRFFTTEPPRKPTIATSSYSHQNSMVWEKLPDRSMEQNWEPRNKLTHIWTINLQPNRGKNILRKDSLFQKWHWEN